MTEKITKASKLWEELDKTWPGLVAGTTDDFYGYDCGHDDCDGDCKDEEVGLWCCGECDHSWSDGWTLFHYWAEDYKEEHYVSGVYKPMEKWLNNRGWYTEWHDAGTIMLYQSS